MNKYFASLAICLAFTAGCACAAPVVSDQSQPDEDGMKSNLQSLSTLLLLQDTDAKSAANNLTNTVGQYYQIVTQADGSKAVQLLGRAAEDLQVDKIELMDKILFQKVIDNTYDAGIAIPWLTLKTNGSDKLSTLIQDLATLTAPTSATFIHDHLPSVDVIDQNLDVYYASAATVTLISQTVFSTNSSGGGVPIISLNGNNVYSKNILSNAYIVSVSKTLAKRATSHGLEIAVERPLYSEDSTVPGMVVKVLPVKNK